MKEAPKQKKAAARLLIYPSEKAIEWLKANGPKDWRSYAEGGLEEHLELLADGVAFARIPAGDVEGFSPADLLSVLSAAEAAGLKRAAEIRTEKRQEALLSGYTKEELRAALEATGEPTEGELQGMLDAHSEDLAHIPYHRSVAGDADEPSPVPPKKGARDDA